MIFIGVDLGSCAVKATAIKGTRQKFEILQTHFFPIKIGESREKRESQKLAHLKTLSNLYAGQEVKYIFCLPQNKISAHTMGFPFKERYKIMKSLPFEMEDKFLFEYEKLVTDIKIIPSPKEQANVLVFSSFKEDIHQLLEQLKLIGIEPFIVTCEASAVSNIIEDKKISHSKNYHNENTKPENYLYLKVGHTHTTIMILTNGKMQNVYNLEWGVTSCIRKIARKYELTDEKAFKQFYEKAFVLTNTKGYTGSQIEFSKIISESFGALIHKLRLLLLELEGGKKYKIKKIFILGGGAQIRNLQTLLSSELDVSVSRLANPAGFSVWNLRNNNQKQNNLITSLGAAMEGLKRLDQPPINFLKDEFAVRTHSLFALSKQWRHALSLSLIGFICLTAYAVLREEQTKKLESIINTQFKKQSLQVTKLSPKKISIQNVKKFINRGKKLVRQNELTEELSNLPSALDRLKALSIKLNNDKAWVLEINNLNIHGEKIEIQGYVSNLYIRNLEKNLLSMAKKGSFKKLPLPQKVTLQNMNQMDKATQKAEELRLSSDTKSAIVPDDEEIVPFTYSFIQITG